MNNNEIRSNSDQKSPKKAVSVYLPETYKASSEILNDSEGWLKSPKAIYHLRKSMGATPTQILVAHALVGLSVGEGRFPTFSAGQSKIAEATGLSPRAISSAVKFLSANRLLFVRYSNGCETQYTWNLVVLKSAANGSVVPLNEVQSSHCNSFTGTTERGAHLYIELSLEFFRTSLEGNFFNKNHSEYEPYTFYKPGKRTKRGTATTAVGSTYTVDRWEAWEEAVHRIWGEIQKEPNALMRIFYALQAKNVEDVAFPYATLRHRVNDMETQHIARKRSHLNFFCDEDVQDFLNRKYKVGEQ